MKHIIVHLGPHKTGSSAIQKCLSQNRNSLLAYGVCFLHDSETLEAALSLAKEDFDQAEVQLNSISKQIEQRSEKVFILSQEDFSGDLPGRSPKRRIYPKLTKNLRVIKRSFRPNRVSFVFFVRDEADWLRSCYAQYLRYRTRFHNFEDFSQHYGFPFLWREKLEKSHQTFGDELQVRNYSKEPMAGVDAILQLAGLDERHHLQTSVGASVNSSPSADTIALLEHINRVSEFRPTSWYAKKLVISGWKPNVPRVSQKTKADWPPRVFGQHACALPKLLERTAKRVPKQSVANILPEQMVPLEPLVFDYLPSNVEMPEISRERIEDQSRILTYHLRGKSRLAHLNALVISYLRRATPHTDHARFIFHRIWEEKGAILVN